MKNQSGKIIFLLVSVLSALTFLAMLGVLGIRSKLASQLQVTDQLSQAQPDQVMGVASRDTEEQPVWDFANTIDITRAPYNAVGNGTFDNYDSFAAVFSYLDLNPNMVLYIPAGTYKIVISPNRFALNLPKHTYIYGDGESSILKFVVTNPSLFATLKFESKSNLVLRDLTLQGDKRIGVPYATQKYWTLLALRLSSKVSLTRVVIKNSQRFGAEIASCKNVHIEGSSFLANGWTENVAGYAPIALVGGLRVTAADSEVSIRNSAITITNSVFDDNGGEGAIISYVDGLTITNSRFTNSGLYRWHGNQDGLVLSGITNGSIMGNVVSDNYSDGIIVVQTSEEDSSKNINLANNTAYNNYGNGILLYSHPDAVAGYIKKVTIVGNTVYDNGFTNTSGYPNSFDGIRLAPWGNAGAISGITIDRNYCYDTRTGTERTQMQGVGQLPAQQDPNGGLGKDIIVSGNMCYNNEHQDIAFWESVLVK